MTHTLPIQCLTRLAIIPCVALCLLLCEATARADTVAPTANTDSSEATALQAIFMEVSGKVRWRATEKASWKEAAIDDVVSQGAEIRTGLKSRAGLRIGKNATVLVDAGTSFQLPSIVQDGGTLRTLATVKSGRVDFKVDKIGFANDFKVVTPQTTLSVRGTGFGVSSGSLAGVEVSGARTNMINAIELQYISSHLQYFLSGSASSSSQRTDPVMNAWISTLGPPQMVGSIVNNNQLEQVASQGQVGNAPTNSQSIQQQNAAESQQEISQNSPLAGLLQLVKGRSSAILQGSTLAGEQAAEGSNAAHIAQVSADTQQSTFTTATGFGTQLETQWSSGSGDKFTTDKDAQVELNGFQTRSINDNQQMVVLRSDMNAAIDAGTEIGVTTALDSMGVIDNSWQTSLKVSVQAIVQSLSALNQSLQQAGELAPAADANFNALFDRASTKVSLAQATAASLAGLRTAIRQFHAAVLTAAKSGNGGSGAIQQLVRSAQMLTDAEARITAALSATDAAVTALAMARSVSERVLLQAVINATLRGTQIMSLASGLQDEINTNVNAIETARFSAFFAAAAAGVTTMNSRAQAVQDEVSPLNGSEGIFTQHSDAVTAGETNSNAVINLATSMDQFWNQAGQSEISPKARLETLLTISQDDRTTVAVLLVSLGESISSQDRSGAILFMGDMTEMDAKWQDTSTGLLVEVNGINSNVQARMAAIDTAFNSATTSKGNIDGLLAQAEARRDAASTAVTLMTQTRDRLAAYQVEYSALIEAGRGGETASASMASAITALSGTVANYNAAIQASRDAAAQVETARSMGQRVFYAAASNAHANAAFIAAQSANLTAGIQTNADAIHTDTVAGQTAFNTAFPGGGTF